MRALALLLAATPAAAQVVPGEPYHDSITCDGVEATLDVGEGGAAPVLMIDGRAIRLLPGPSYAGPVCVSTGGEVPYVGFTEFMGNAYEVYRLVDPVTLSKVEITYEEAEALDWWDEGP